MQQKVLRQKLYRRLIKRAFDLAGAVVGLIVTLPVTLPLAAVLAVVNGGSPIFLQPRSGRGGRRFDILKFKTMTDARDETGRLLPDHQRTHPLGRWVRRSSLDELPQMINVLKGEMSFIGPRPLLERYLPLYDAVQSRRHEVRPGMTGWAQTRGRNAMGWPRRLELDVWYVDNLSPGLDARIVVATIAKILRREGIDAGPATTMIPFDEWLAHGQNDHKQTEP
jgi:lipopolysaccharide/colanic/teichoic acid biosynthesis glycosyltransferase